MHLAGLLGRPAHDQTSLDAAWDLVKELEQRRAARSCAMPCRSSAWRPALPAGPSIEVAREVLELSPRHALRRAAPTATPARRQDETAYLDPVMAIAERGRNLTARPRRALPEHNWGGRIRTRFSKRNWHDPRAFSRRSGYRFA